MDAINQISYLHCERLARPCITIDQANHCMAKALGGRVTNSIQDGNQLMSFGKGEEVCSKDWSYQ
jgi:hypothetical protein